MGTHSQGAEWESVGRKKEEEETLGKGVLTKFLLAEGGQVVSQLWIFGEKSKIQADMRVGFTMQGFC